MPPHVITKATALAHPDKFGYSEIVPFLPACYNLPVKMVQAILNTSHGTLARAREAWGLSKWPYDDIMKERFSMSWEEIDQLQQAMLQGANEKMGRFLRLISQKSREYKNRPKKIRASKAKVLLVSNDSLGGSPDDEDEEGSAVGMGESTECKLLTTSPEDTQDEERVGEEIDQLLLQKLQEDTSLPPSPQEVVEMSDWQRFYDLLDPAREPVEPASPSLLEDDCYY
jgi:hypothetical protein